MKRKILSWVVVFCVLMSSQITVFATDLIDNDLLLEEIEFYITEESTNKEFRLVASLNLPIDVKNDRVFYIIHGRMRKNDNAHHGFDYIVKELCELGYRVISLNIMSLYNTPDRTTAEIDNVINAVNTSFEYIHSNYEGFGDIKNISFIGHSRGGFHVLKVSEYLLSQEIPKYTVDSILSIAPYVLDWEKISLPDVETSILVPEFDGDVSELDGCKLYRETVKSGSDRKTVLRNVYLFGGNHNYFSREMKIDDTAAYLTLGQKYDLYRITREVQEEFLLDFVLKYMTTEENKSIRLSSLHIVKEYDGSYIPCDMNNIDISLINAFYSKVKVNSQYSTGESWILEPGYKETEYSLLRFNKNNSYLLLDLEDKKYDNILLELTVDPTKYISSDVNLEFIVEYVESEKESDIFSFKPTYVRGTLDIKNRNTLYMEAFWDRKILIEEFKLGTDENYTVDKIIVKTNKPTQIVFRDIYLDDTINIIQEGLLEDNVEEVSSIEYIEQMQ